MPSLADLLRGANDEDQKPRISHAGQIACLSEYLTAYQAPLTLKIGDLVTPKRSSCLRGAGEPHIVVDLIEDPSFVFQGELGSNYFGKRLDVRTASLTPDGRVAAYWMERVDLEPYRAEAATGEPADHGEAEAA